MNRWISSVLFNPTVSFFWSHQNSFPLLFSLGLIIVMLLLALLDYCNALAGSPQVLLDKIQSDHLLSSPHLQSSLICPHHSFTISTGYQSAAGFNTKQLSSVSGKALPYVSDLLYPHSPSRSLRTTSDTRIFRIPRMGRRTLGERFFNSSDLWYGTLFLHCVFTLFF